MNNLIEKQYHRYRFFLKKNYRYLRTRLMDDPHKKTIVIHQMGKVGSTSILHSLKKYSSQLNVYHSHSLSHQALEQNEQEYRQHFSKMGTVYEHYIHSTYLRAKLDRQQISDKWKVITLVRDPIARDISAFFQQFLWKYKDNFRYIVNSETDQEKLNVVKNIFFDDFIKKPSWFNSTLTWIDKELNEIFDLNIYNESFDIQRGHQFYSSNVADILLIRLEDLDSIDPRLIGEFVGIENLSIEKGNIGNKKFYSDIYQLFKENMGLPKEYVKEVYSSKYAKHFYSEHELDQFASKWLKLPSEKV